MTYETPDDSAIQADKPLPKLIRIDHVIQLTGLSKSTIYNLMQKR